MATDIRYVDTSARSLLERANGAVRGARWESVNRQDLPRLYHRNGALYVVRRETLMDDGVILGGEMVAYEMSSRWSANVDDERDLVVCDVVMREWLEEMG